MAKRTKNPKGGLTQAGRDQFRKTDGSRLKAGVKKKLSEMTPDEMRRKGSWAVRFYGRKGRLPPLKDDNGEPTRFALTAAAWGEPVPKTIAAARRIAAKGRRLLERYEAQKKRKTKTRQAQKRSKRAPARKAVKRKSTSRKATRA